MFQNNITSTIKVTLTTCTCHIHCVDIHAIPLLIHKPHTVHESDAFTVWVVLLWVIRSFLLLPWNSHRAHGNVTSCLCFFPCFLRILNTYSLKPQFSYMNSLDSTLPEHPSILSSVDQPLHNQWAQRYELLLQGAQLCHGCLCCFVLSISKLQMFI